MDYQHVTMNLPICVVVQDKTVKIQDMVQIAGSNEELVKKLGEKVFYEFGEQDERVIFSSLTVIRFLEKEFPGLTVCNDGNTEVIIKYKPAAGRKNKIYDLVKITIVSLAILIGSMFTIMTFNSDVDVAAVFETVYGLMGYANTGSKVLEISYSIGIFAGISLFFNHYSRKKMTADPTPIKVQMQSYEQGVNQTVIQEAVRSGEVK
ncbi:MAG: stage V sporulation protein AA [Lachnospiraceae bacterium]